MADFWPTFGRLLADFGLTLGRLLADFWPTLGRLLADFGPTFAQLWADFGATFGRLWADFGTTLGRLLGDFGMIEVRGLANRSEGLGQSGPVDKSEGYSDQSIKRRGLGGWAGPRSVDKCAGFGPAKRSDGFLGLPHLPTLLGKPQKHRIRSIIHEPAFRQFRAAGAHTLSKSSAIWQAKR